MQNPGLTGNVVNLICEIIDFILDNNVNFKGFYCFSVQAPLKEDDEDDEFMMTLDDLEEDKVKLQINSDAFNKALAKGIELITKFHL